jgi:hypothetical protein
MLPHFLDNPLTDGGEFVTLMHQPRFTPKKISDTHFSYRLRQSQGRCKTGMIKSVENLGIEPTTLRLVAWCPNQPVPLASKSFPIDHSPVTLLFYAVGQGTYTIKAKSSCTHY